MFLKNRLLNEGNQELRTVFQSPKQFCFYCKTLETKKKKISKKLCVSFEIPFLFKSIKNSVTYNTAFLWKVCCLFSEVCVSSFNLLKYLFSFSEKLSQLSILNFTYYSKTISSLNMKKMSH